VTATRRRRRPPPVTRRRGAATVTLVVVALVALFGAVAAQRAIAAPAAGPARAAPPGHELAALGPALTRQHDGRPRRAQTAAFGLAGVTRPSWPALVAAARPGTSAAPLTSAACSTRSRAPPT